MPKKKTPQKRDPITISVYGKAPNIIEGLKKTKKLRSSKVAAQLIYNTNLHTTVLPVICVKG